MENVDIDALEGILHDHAGLDREELKSFLTELGETFDLEEFLGVAKLLDLD